ncbi:hypothetical protein MIR68_003099 [Amoeboaphelidium protococcarum]|nr:hypothetical protein MIR68_003099 [Amoeboaphelidium protococcarum]
MLGQVHTIQDNNQDERLCKRIRLHYDQEQGFVATAPESESDTESECSDHKQQDAIGGQDPPSPASKYDDITSSDVDQAIGYQSQIQIQPDIDFEEEFRHVFEDDEDDLLLLHADNYFDLEGALDCDFDELERLATNVWTGREKDQLYHCLRQYPQWNITKYEQIIRTKTASEIEKYLNLLRRGSLAVGMPVEQEEACDDLSCESDGENQQSDEDELESRMETWKIRDDIMGKRSSIMPSDQEWHYVGREYDLAEERAAYLVSKQEEWEAIKMERLRNGLSVQFASNWRQLVEHKEYERIKQDPHFIYKDHNSYLVYSNQQYNQIAPEDQYKFFRGWIYKNIESDHRHPEVTYYAEKFLGAQSDDQVDSDDDEEETLQQKPTRKVVKKTAKKSKKQSNLKANKKAAVISPYIDIFYINNLKQLARFVFINHPDAHILEESFIYMFMALIEDFITPMLHILSGQDLEYLQMYSDRHTTRHYSMTNLKRRTQFTIDRQMIEDGLYALQLNRKSCYCKSPVHTRLGPLIQRWISKLAKPKRPIEYSEGNIEQFMDERTDFRRYLQQHLTVRSEEDIEEDDQSTEQD